MCSLLGASHAQLLDQEWIPGPTSLLQHTGENKLHATKISVVFEHDDTRAVGFIVTVALLKTNRQHCTPTDFLDY